MLEKLFGEVRGIFNTITIIDLIVSLLCVFLGIYFFASQDLNTIVVAVITGILLIANGISSILSYIKRGGIVIFNLNLIFGIALIIIGLVALFLNNYLKIALGIYLITVGAQKINYGILFKKFNESSWLLTLVIGIILIIMSIILFFTSIDNVVSATGIALFGYGLFNIVNTILLRRRSNYFIA